MKISAIWCIRYLILCVSYFNGVFGIWMVFMVPSVFLLNLFTQFDHFIPRPFVAVCDKCDLWGKVIPQVIWPLPPLQACERSQPKSSLKTLQHLDWVINAAKDKVVR